MDIDRVCCIIDLDGFNFRSWQGGSSHKNEFLIRELGYIRIDPKYGPFLPKSYRFDLRFYDFSKCKGESWNTLHYQTRHITGLSLKPGKNEVVHSYDDRFKIMKRIYNSCHFEELDVVAFKGGIWEQVLLDELKIPCLDLRQYGCPTYDQLVKNNMVHSFINDCGNHKNISEDVELVHCPLAEVVAYADWLLTYCTARSPEHVIRQRGPCGSTAGYSFARWSSDSSLD